MSRPLKKAIQQLPTYEPSGAVWSRIEADLELHHAVQQLPTYEPSGALWEKIEADLPKKGRRIALVWRSVAAAVLVLVAATFWWQLQSNEASVLVERSEEVQNNIVLAADWNADEADFERVAKLCVQHPFLCETKEVQTLQEELAELEEAKAVLLQQMNKYGKQARLIHQVKNIEQERSEVVRAIVKEI